MKEKIKEKVLEELAELEHEQWMKWSKTIIDNFLKDSLSGTDACKVRDNVLKKHQSWLKYWKPYWELSEEVKEEDRIWARKVLIITSKQFENKIKELIKKSEEAIEQFKEQPILKATYEGSLSVLEELQNLLKDIKEVK